MDIPVAQEDFEGRAVTFKMTYVHNNPFRTAAAKSYVTDDGTLHLTFRNDRAGQIGVVKVDATIGTGETAITRSTYVFVKTQTDIDKVVVYKPMVFRVNPRTGGYSEAPTPTRRASPNHDLAETQYLLLQFRRSGIAHQQ